MDVSNPRPKYTLRAYSAARHDLSAVGTIGALGNLADPLARYMRRDMPRYWTSFRAGNLRFPSAQLAKPGCVGWVIECDNGDGSRREVVGWAIWTRHGKSAKAREWQRANGGVWMRLERVLLAVEDWYWKHMPGVDPSAVKGHIAELVPALREGWPVDVFGEEYWQLEGLYTHPNHYRRGVGRMLASWGVERGREEGVCVVLHASPMGKGLYQSVGFEVVKRMEGLDKYIPEFKEDLKVKSEVEAMGAWTMCWQPEGMDVLERARKKAREGTWNDVDKNDGKGAKMVVPEAAISVT